jgi:hypothetical protein
MHEHTHTHTQSQDLGQLLSVRVKPMQKKFEMEYALDPASQNYDQQGPKHPLKKMKLSSQPVPPKTNYAIGVVREGQLHLTPLHAVCRMLPNFEHIDEQEREEAGVVIVPKEVPEVRLIERSNFLCVYALLCNRISRFCPWRLLSLHIPYTSSLLHNPPDDHLFAGQAAPGEVQSQGDGAIRSIPESDACLHEANPGSRGICRAAAAPLQQRANQRYLREPCVTLLASR